MNTTNGGERVVWQKGEVLSGPDLTREPLEAENFLQPISEENVRGSKPEKALTHHSGVGWRAQEMSRNGGDLGADSDLHGRPARKQELLSYSHKDLDFANESAQTWTRPQSLWAERPLEHPDFSPMMPSGEPS